MNDINENIDNLRIGELLELQKKLSTKLSISTELKGKYLVVRYKITRCFITSNSDIEGINNELEAYIVTKNKNLQILNDEDDTTELIYSLAIFRLDPIYTTDNEITIKDCDVIINLFKNFNGGGYSYGPNRISCDHFLSNEEIKTVIYLEILFGC